VPVRRLLRKQAARVWAPRVLRPTCQRSRVLAGGAGPPQAIVMILLLTSIAIGSAVALKNERAADAPRTIRSLAVLPFEDFSGDSTRQSFAEGMHEALITELAAILS